MEELKDRYDLIIKIKKILINGYGYSQIKVLWVKPSECFFSNYLCIYPGYIVNINNNGAFFVDSNRNNIIYNCGRDITNKWLISLLNDDINFKYLIVNEKW